MNVRYLRALCWYQGTLLLELAQHYYSNKYWFWSLKTFGFYSKREQNSYSRNVWSSCYCDAYTPARIQMYTLYLYCERCVFHWCNVSFIMGQLCERPGWIYFGTKKRILILDSMVLLIQVIVFVYQYFSCACQGPVDGLSASHHQARFSREVDGYCG